MRIVVGGISHESNTLNPIITGREDFVAFLGSEIFERGMLPYYSSTGIIKTLKAADCEIIPTIVARAVPNGVVSNSLYNEYKTEILNRIKEALKDGPIDGVCLGLHGSMKVENIGCIEGRLLVEIRDLLPEAVITVSLDMHATVTPLMMKNADAFAGYKTAPHIDCYETGALAAKMLLTSLNTGKKLFSAYCKVPMLIAGEKSESAVEPMTDLMDLCRETEKQPGILAASYLLGFPWADDKNNSVTALVSGIDNVQPIKKAATELADAFWNRRADFIFRCEYYSSRKSLEIACKAVISDGTRPVFVSDSGDNPTAGSTGDSTELLNELMDMTDKIKSLPTPLLYSGFFTAEACAKCVTADVSTEISLDIGGFWDRTSGKPVKVDAKIVKIVRGYGPYNSDLVLIEFDNIRMVLTSMHIGFGDEDLLPALGVEAADYCIVIVKLGYLEACFRDIAARAIMATSKGCSNELLETIAYKRLKRPIYPLDPEMDYKTTEPTKK